MRVLVVRVHVRASSLPGVGLFTAQQPDTWDAALTLLAAALPPTASTGCGRCRRRIC
ncbi:hypothetical protein [Micromonospora harpali]|uniref:Uncharacterized protein n=1 Tax=Micromonospora harpali TaxID=1490225 RepID=A0ABW1HY95_9ACTN